jgi:hypothetical protein
MFKVKERNSYSNNEKVFRIANIKGSADKLTKRSLFLVNDGSGEDEIKLDGKEYFAPCNQFRKHQNERLYVAGPSGSGKSTYVADYVTQFLKEKGLNDTTVYIFSSVDYDKILDERFGDRIYRIDVDDPICYEEGYHPEEFEEGSIIIFDDVDKIKNSKCRNAIYMLRENVLETGRHYGLTVISTSHQLSNYAKTRTLLSEATSITVFPRHAGTTHYIREYLKKHTGFDLPKIKKFLSLSKNSRWITLYRNAPPYVISAKCVYKIHDEYLDD